MYWGIYQPLVNLIKDLFSGDFERYKGLPRGCRRCELLGICRRPKEEGWKCYNGCLVMPPSYPKRCQKCDKLTECRRPLSEGGKCRAGCLKIKEEETEKYAGLKKGCWRCEYLTECREPKEQGWKCRNGCLKIKERNLVSADYTPEFLKDDFIKNTRRFDDEKDVEFND